MGIFPLPIFPEGSLSQSVITTVWVGVLFVCFFNLRFGWPFSGLVVPGYLVPLMITRPVVAGVIITEGLAAYGLVHALCRPADHATRWWSSLFGRDRFLAIVLASLLLRITLDGWAFPALGDWLRERHGVGLDFRNNLSSFGLIVTALLANQFWKSGLRRGLWPFTVTLASTYTAVRYGLMEWTNFNVGSIEYMYEAIASSLEASAKPYIIVVTSAFLASRMNLTYAWECGGVLIPGLLALEWYEPAKILATLAEALIVLLAGKALLKSRLFQGRTVEGARKLLLFFNLSFAYKFLLAHALADGSAYRPADCFGLGYLVPTLLAVKMHDRVPLRLCRTTLQISLAGVALATAVGFGLLYLPRSGWTLARAVPAPASGATVEASDKTLWETLREEKIRLYTKRTRGTFLRPRTWEAESFRAALAALEEAIRRGQAGREGLAWAAALLDRAGYRLELLEGSLLCLRDRDAARHWGTYVLDAAHPGGVVVEVPAPLEEWATLESGLALFRVLGGGHLPSPATCRPPAADPSPGATRRVSFTSSTGPSPGATFFRSAARASGSSPRWSGTPASHPARAGSQAACGSGASTRAGSPAATCASWSVPSGSTGSRLPSPTCSATRSRRVSLS